MSGDCHDDWLKSLGLTTTGFWSAEEIIDALNRVSLVGAKEEWTAKCWERLTWKETFKKRQQHDKSDLFFLSSVRHRAALVSLFASSVMKQSSMNCYWRATNEQLAEIKQSQNEKETDWSRASLSVERYGQKINSCDEGRQRARELQRWIFLSFVADQHQPIGPGNTRDKKSDEEKKEKRKRKWISLDVLIFSLSLASEHRMVLRLTKISHRQSGFAAIEKSLSSAQSDFSHWSLQRSFWCNSIDEQSDFAITARICPR